MGYAVKEIFLTLQGEGFHAGRAAVFCRFTGCNLWSGRESDRPRGVGGCARWCDTDFVGTDGPGGGRFDDAESLADAVSRCWPWDRGGRPFVVCTGGEPLLQLDEDLTRALGRRGFEVAIETNGTLALPAGPGPQAGIDWVCVSPKAGTALRLAAGDELKLVYPQPGAEPERYAHLPFGHFFLQPMDGPARAENTALAVRYCLLHPQWRLSLQTHKLLGIP